MKGNHPGNQDALKHGGAAAVMSIEKGEPLRGLAASTEQVVRSELEASGRYAMVQNAAIRLETAARLYWDAFVKAANDGDLDKVDRYAARYGWLQAGALRAWAQVKVEQDKAKRETLNELLGRVTDDKQA
jgi:predicted RecA/RadA family phage recombinase